MKLHQYIRTQSIKHATNHGMMLYISPEKKESFEKGFELALDLDLAVKFMNWTLTSDCEFQCVDEDEWNDPDYFNNRKTYTTKELYDYWVQNVLEL